MSQPEDPTDSPTTAPPPESAPPRTAAQEYDDALDTVRATDTDNRHRAVGRFLSTLWTAFGARALDTISDVLEGIHDERMEKHAAAFTDNDDDDDTEGVAAADPDADLTHFHRQPDGSVRATAMRFDATTGTFVNLDGSPGPTIPPTVATVINAIREAVLAAQAKGLATTPPGAPSSDAAPLDDPSIADA